MGGRGYNDALAALDRALVFGINPSLDGISELCEALGRPHAAFRSIQVTGTNGKTSTCRITEALLREHGLRTALYTSPELERPTERICVAGRESTPSEFAEAVFAALDAAERLRPGAQGGDAGFTEFELVTAAALWAFARAGVEVAVLEVGMGGRWDATSVVDPEVAVITGVGLDHAAILGDTRELIAAEKAAIIKPGSHAVLGPGTAGVDDIFLARTRSAASLLAVRDAAAESPIDEASTLRFTVEQAPDTPGGCTVLSVSGRAGDYPGMRIAAPRYQAANVAVAMAAAERALGGPLDGGRTQTALDRLTLPGRFELVRENPPVIVDGAHNPQAAGVLAEALSDAWPDPAGRPIVLLGVLADKDAAGIVAALAPVAGGFLVTAPDSSRARPAGDLAHVVRQVTGVQPRAVEPLATAVREALRSAETGLVVTGSLTTAGQARMLLRDVSAT